MLQLPFLSVVEAFLQVWTSALLLDLHQSHKRFSRECLPKYLSQRFRYVRHLPAYETVGRFALLLVRPVSPLHQGATLRVKTPFVRLDCQTTT